MKNQSNVDIIYIDQINTIIEDIINKENIQHVQTKEHIAKLTQLMSREEQSVFLNDYLHLRYFDTDPEIMVTIDLIDLYSLNKLKGD